MGRATKIAVGSGLGIAATLAIAIVLLLNFDWNRAKPWISSRVTEATGRPFAIDGDLSLTWHAPQGEGGWRAWVPWPRLNARNVAFGNSDWATEPWMARAQQVTFSVSPLPLLNHRLVIPSLALEAPRLELERRQDGRNNWTFKSSGQPSAWQLELQRLILNKGSLHVVDAIKRADLKAELDTLPAQTEDGYRLGWHLGGTYNGETVDGNGKAGGILSLQQKDVKYPLEAKLRVGKTQIEAKGTLTDPRKLSALDLRLRVAGVSMAQLYPLINVVLPETRPFVTEGRLVGSPDRRGGNWLYEKFTGKMGSSDVAGTLRYEAREPRALLEGSIVSNLLNFNDLSPLIGADSEASKAERGSKTVQPPNKVLPVEPFRTERWTSIDADVQFSGRKIVRQQELPIDNLVTRVHLRDGVLSLAPLKFGIAGGNLVSNLTLNGKSKPVKAEMRLSARHLKLRQLFPTLESMEASLGEINGDAALTSSGNSVAALLGSADGEVRAVINQGTMSKLLLEKMGLNIGSIVLTQLFGDRQVKLNCAANDFKVEKGVMQTRAFVIDTEDAKIYVNGKINLAQEQLNLTIYPESKGVRLISLRSPLYVNGPFKQPKVGVDKAVLAAKAGSAVALGVLAPITALIPLVNVGPGERSECGTLLAQLTEKQAPRAAAPNGRGNTSSGQ
jgi:hypothetical protein